MFIVRIRIQLACSSICGSMESVSLTKQITN